MNEHEHDQMIMGITIMREIQMLMIHKTRKMSIIIMNLTHSLLSPVLAQHEVKTITEALLKQIQKIKKSMRKIVLPLLKN